MCPLLIANFSINVSCNVNDHILKWQLNNVLKSQCFFRKIGFFLTLQFRIKVYFTEKSIESGIVAVDFLVEICFTTPDHLHLIKSYFKSVPVFSR